MHRGSYLNPTESRNTILAPMPNQPVPSNAPFPTCPDAEDEQQTTNSLKWVEEITARVLEQRSSPQSPKLDE